MDPGREQSAIQLVRHLPATAGTRVNPIRELLPVEVVVKSLPSPANGNSSVQLHIQTLAKHRVQDCTLLFPLLHAAKYQPSRVRVLAALVGACLALGCRLHRAWLVQTRAE